MILLTACKVKVWDSTGTGMQRARADKAVAQGK